MSRIKTRERAKGKEVKVLDKSAVVGQRMKNAFIRSKRNGWALMDDRQATPSEYAEDKAQFAADDLVHDTANVAVSGTKTVVRQGRKLFQRQREKKAAEKRQENTTPTEQTQAPSPGPQTGTAPEGQLPRQCDRLAPTQAQRSGSCRERRSGERSDPCLPGRSEGYGTCSGEERGRALAKKRTAERAEAQRWAKERPVRSSGPAGPRIGPTAGRTIDGQSIKTGQRSGHTVSRAVGSAGRTMGRTAQEGRRTIRTVKTAERTSKAAIKAAEHTAQTARKTAQATVKAARAAAEAAAATRSGMRAASATARAVAASSRTLAATIAAGGGIAGLAVVIVCMIGLIVSSSVGILFSGEESGTGQTMPAVVREIDREYTAKLEEIKCANAADVLEMSGSRSLWPDVLAVYAVKVSNDPDDPQIVAIMDDNKKALLKEMFWTMNEVSSRMETSTTTQTVETDDGAGNILAEEVEVTTTTLYITVSHKTAEEMADIYGFSAEQRAQLSELLDGDARDLWSRVLYGISGGDGAIVTVALSQIGNVGGQPYWSWYGFDSRVEWCACFVSWCANECGYIDAGIVPKTAGCIDGAQWFKDRGLWQDRDYEPRPGDIIYFDWDNKGSSGPQDGLADHVGIVEKVEDGIVYTVEGNSGDSCRENRYSIGHYEIYGYGLLSF